MCEVDEEHPFVQHELLMPVIGLFRLPDAADAIAAALRVEHGFGHTATMYSHEHRQHCRRWRALCNARIFVKNGSVVRGPRPRRRGLHLVHDRLARPAKA